MIASTSRAVVTFCGYGIPWLMIVLSSATTGVPRSMACRTSALYSRCGTTGGLVMAERYSSGLYSRGKLGETDRGIYGKRGLDGDSGGSAAVSRREKRIQAGQQRRDVSGDHGVARSCYI